MVGAGAAYVETAGLETMGSREAKGNMTMEPHRKRLSPAQRREIYGKTGGHCAYCGTTLTFKEMQVDHVVPLRRGGSDTLDNMLPACRSCNRYKGSCTLEGFREMLENQPYVLMRDSVTYQIAVRYGLVKPSPHQVMFYFEKPKEADCEPE